MPTRSFLKWVSASAIVGCGVALLLLTILAVSPDSWHRHLGTPFLVLCPPSILLMAYETCSGWLSWCSAEIILAVTGLNALVYSILGAALWLLSSMLSFGKGRSSDAV